MITVLQKKQAGLPKANAVVRRATVTGPAMKRVVVPAV